MTISGVFRSGQVFVGRLSAAKPMALKNDDDLKASGGDLDRRRMSFNLAGLVVLSYFF
jgi:hypothetical protein